MNYKSKCYMDETYYYQHQNLKSKKQYKTIVRYVNEYVVKK